MSFNTRSWDDAFEEAATLAVAAWDKTEPFIALDLGCGPGRGQVRLLKKLKALVRGANPQAVIQVFQLDLPHVSAEAVALNAQEWEDNLCRHTFVPQSFYAPLRVQPARVHFFFSQAALHWVEAFLPLEPAARGSGDTRDAATQAFQKVLQNLEAKSASGSVLAAMLLGSSGDDARDEALDAFNQRVSKAIHHALPPEEASLLAVTLQVPHRLADLAAALAGPFVWAKGGAVLASPAPLQVTPAVAQHMARTAILSSPVWHTRWLQVFPHRKDEVDFVLRRIAAAYAAVVEFDPRALASPDPGCVWFIAQHR